MAESQSGCQEESFFGEHSYYNNDQFKSVKDSSNPEKEFNS